MRERERGANFPEHLPSVEHHLVSLPEAKRSVSIEDLVITDSCTSVSEMLCYNRRLCNNMMYIIGTIIPTSLFFDMRLT